MAGNFLEVIRNLQHRNVPADALKKVQIFDKKSDESEFTGIDDGKRDKTLNLLLKDDRKNAIFGELLGGSRELRFLSGKRQGIQIHREESVCCTWDDQQYKSVRFFIQGLYRFQRRDCRVLVVTAEQYR